MRNWICNGAHVLSMPSSWFQLCDFTFWKTIAKSNSWTVCTQNHQPLTLLITCYISMNQQPWDRSTTSIPVQSLLSSRPMEEVMDSMPYGIDVSEFPQIFKLAKLPYAGNSFSFLNGLFRVYFISKSRNFSHVSFFHRLQSMKNWTCARPTYLQTWKSDKLTTFLQLTMIHKRVIYLTGATWLTGWAMLANSVVFTTARSTLVSYFWIRYSATMTFHARIGNSLQRPA